MNIMQKYKIKQEERARKQQEALEDQIVLAQQVRNFFETDLGRYLEEKMDTDIKNIKDKLVIAQPEDVFLLQEEFRVINKIKGYLAQAILAGNNAEKALQLNANDFEE